MALTSPGLLAVTDQKSSPAYECDRSRNGSVHGSNVSPDLPVQGQVIQQILAAAPPRDHSVRVFLSLLSFIATLAFTTSTPAHSRQSHLANVDRNADLSFSLLSFPA